MNKRKSSKQRQIIMPPADDASYEELDGYFSKHSLHELEKAGLAHKLSSEEKKVLELASDAIKTSRKTRTQLNLAFPETDLSRFVRYAQCKHMPASTLARAWILERLDYELRHSK